ncbi:MAG TPA: MarR family transcriptional regulator [Terriglobales bacterium]|nr:MarR family transcriptional regulator [Terriglobales bacterium]
MKLSDVQRLQRDYPRIYLACHVRHVRTGSTPYRLSSRDSAILAHLDTTVPITATELASHLGIRTSTMSAAIQKLAKLGYLQRQPSGQDRRVAHVTITPRGAQAMAETSVLDSARVAAVLRRLSRPQRNRALAGLQLLAKACWTFMIENSRG